MKLKFPIVLFILMLGNIAQANYFPTPPPPGTPAVDPARCKKGDRNYIYWAAGDQVFRFKYRPEEPVYPIERLLNDWQKGTFPKAPNPSEAVGCYDNPLRFGFVPYILSYEAEIFKKLTGREIDIEPLASHGAEAIPQRSLNDSGLQRHIKDFFHKSTACKFILPEMVECIYKRAYPESDYMKLRFYRVAGSHFSSDTPINDIYFSYDFDLAARFPRGKNPGTGKLIESSFDLYKTLRIDTGIRLFPEEIRIMPQYYQKMIDYVTQAHVPNYQWTPK